MVITLGQEALDAVIASADEVHGVPRKLTPDSYGRPGTATVAGHCFQLLPLVHPGFLRQTKREDWLAAFAAWEAATAHELNPMISGRG